MIGPSPRQLEVLEHLDALTCLQAPAFRELAKASKMRSLNQLHEVVRALLKKGLLEWSRDGRSRIVSPAGRRWLRQKRRPAA